MPNESAPAQDSQRLAGRYESVEALEKGYNESAAEAQRLKARLDAIESENRALKLAGRSAPESDTDAATLEESGIDVAALERFLTKRSRLAAREESQEALRPIISAAQAQVAIPTELQPAANKLLTENQEIAETYQILLDRNPTRAAGFLVQAVRMHDAEAGMKEEDKAVKEDRERRRADAALPTSRGGAGGRGEDDSAETAERDAAKRKVLIERGIAAGGINKAIASEFLKGRVKVIERLDEPPRTI